MQATISRGNTYWKRSWYSKFWMYIGIKRIPLIPLSLRESCKSLKEFISIIQVTCENYINYSFNFIDFLCNSHVANCMTFFTNVLLAVGTYHNTEYNVLNLLQVDLSGGEFDISLWSHCWVGDKKQTGWPSSASCSEYTVRYCYLNYS